MKIFLYPAEDGPHETATRSHARKLTVHTVLDHAGTMATAMAMSMIHRTEVERTSKRSSEASKVEQEPISPSSVFAAGGDFSSSMSPLPLALKDMDVDGMAAASSWAGPRPESHREASQRIARRNSRERCALVAAKASSNELLEATTKREDSRSKGLRVVMFDSGGGPSPPTPPNTPPTTAAAKRLSLPANENSAAWRTPPTQHLTPSFRGEAALTVEKEKGQRPASDADKHAAHLRSLAWSREKLYDIAAQAEEIEANEPPSPPVSPSSTYPSAVAGRNLPASPRSRSSSGLTAVLLRNIAWGARSWHGGRGGPGREEECVYAGQYAGGMGGRV